MGDSLRSTAQGVARVVAEKAEAVERRVLDRLRRWVEHETPSGDEPACIALATDIASVFSGAGAEVETVDAPGWGRHVVARLPGREAGLDPIVVLGHLDTVHKRGTITRQPFRIVDGRAEGPGIYDMKAGLAVLAEAAILLRETGSMARRPVTIVMTCDEEVGSETSRVLIESLARGAAATLVLEPSLSDGAAKTRRKGVAIYRVTAHGRASHAGLEPEKGVSAILELTRQIADLWTLEKPEIGTTINVGLISGGTASNVVPAEAWAEIDVRFTTDDEARRIDDAVNALRPALPGARLTIEGGVNRPPFERTDEVVRLYHHARELAAEIGFELGEGGAGGASDGNFTAALGVPTLDGLGPLGGGAHSTEEHVVIADLTRRAAFYGRLLETL
mgnify:CR=1 FL=1